METKQTINKGMLALTIALAVVLVVVLFMPNLRTNEAQAQPQSLPAQAKEIVAVPTPPVVEKAPITKELKVDWLVNTEQYKAVVLAAKDAHLFDYSIEDGKVYEMMSVAHIDGNHVYLKVLLGDVKKVKPEPNYVELWCVNGKVFRDEEYDEEPKVYKCNEFTIDWGFD